MFPQSFKSCMGSVKPERRWLMEQGINKLQNLKIPQQLLGRHWQQFRRKWWPSHGETKQQQNYYVLDYTVHTLGGAHHLVYSQKDSFIYVHSLHKTQTQCGSQTNSSSISLVTQHTAFVHIQIGPDTHIQTMLPRTINFARRVAFLTGQINYSHNDTNSRCAHIKN